MATVHDTVVRDERKISEGRKRDIMIESFILLWSAKLDYVPIIVFRHIFVTFFLTASGSPFWGDFATTDGVAIRDH